MNKTILAYILLGITLVIGMVSYQLPASVAWNLLGPGTLQGLTVRNLQGTVWQGSANVKPDALPPLHLVWSLGALPLLIGRVATDLEISGDGVQGNFQLTYQLLGGRQTLAGDALVSSRYVNQVSTNYGLQTTGEFTLTNLDAELAEGRLASAIGRLDWPGGTIHIDIAGDLLTRNVPPLVATISPNAGNTLLQVTTGSTQLMHLKIKPDGWVEVAVLNALLQILDLPLAGGADPAFLLEEKYW